MMDLFALLVSLLVAAGVGWVVARPLLRPARQRSAAPPEISSLEAQLDQVVEAVQELDFDRALGKISAEDYSPHRAELLARGTELLKELDGQRNRFARLRSQQEEFLEQEIAARRQAVVPSASRSDRLEDKVRLSREGPSAPPKASRSRRAGHCPRCGLAVQVGDRFCPQCGVALNHGI